MKKLTKRLTMIVAILLSLVLLSSSVVSTTLAKYVVAKNATTTVTLNKFGVEVTFSGTGNATTKKGDSVTYTNTLAMSPGDSGKITAKIKGKPTVDANITINFEVDYDSSKYTISKNDFSFLGSTASKVYFPIGFKLGTTDVVAPYVNGTSAADTTVSSTIESKITEKLTGLEWTVASAASSATWDSDSTTSDYTNAEKDISITFYWPKDYNTTKGEDTPYDEIGTYLSKDGTKTFTVTYTITVEQA